MTDKKPSLIIESAPAASAMASTAAGPNGERCDQCTAGLFPDKKGPLGFCRVDPPKHFMFMLPQQSAKMNAANMLESSMSIAPQQFSSWPFVQRDQWCRSAFVRKEDAKN